jgi:hypothetical protein
MAAEHEFPLWPDNPSPLDLLGFSDVAEPIVNALKRDRLDPVAIGVFGDWGSGKSTVLELVQADLAGNSDIVVVYTQPWEYDPATDPRATLIGEVLDAVRRQAEEAAEGDLKETIRDKFKDLAGKVRWSKAIGLATRSAVSLTPPSIDDLTSLFGKDEEPEHEPSIQGFRDEYAELMSQLDSITRVIVLVDDLDRCLPPAVVGTLEEIKLFLSVPKMGFVIAADERVVEQAIATQYADASQAEVLGRQYVEKIVQIPLRVPALGESDTKAYLALLLLHRHFSDNDDGFQAVVEHTVNRRSESADDVLDELPEEMIPQEAREELAIAEQLAPLLTRRLEGNPRRLKRFMNAYWLRADIARRRKAELEPGHMAKLLLLERTDDDGFRQLLNWLNQGKIDEKLRRVEEAKEKDKLDPDEELLREWAQGEPKLAEVNLGPYLRLAASLTSKAGPRSQLRSDLRVLLDPMIGGETGPRQKALKQAVKLPPEDRIELGREMARELVANPSRQEDIAPALSELGSDEQVGREIVARLADLSARSVQPDLVIRIRDLPGADELITGWVESGNLSEIAKNTAEKSGKRQG